MTMPMPRRPHVVQLLGPSTGGIRTHVGELARRLTARGWEVDVVGPTLVMDGVGDQTGEVEVPSGWNPLAVRRARRQLKAHLAGADLVHAHGLKAALVVLAGRHPPLVLTIHNLVAGTQRGPVARVLRLVERAIIRRADHVVVISDEIGQRIDTLVDADRRTFVLPVAPGRTVGVAPAEVRASYGIAADAPLVVIVARHHRQKDLPMFLRAFAEVHRVMPTARAVMVGDGPERRAVEAERDRLGLTDVVVVAGHRPNPVDEMNAADVVALSSSWEGSPLAVAECLALGRPLVSTAVGTVTRHLTDGVDARIVAAGDDRAFAAALVEVLGDPDLARALGTTGRATAERTFDADRLVGLIEEVYRSVLVTA